MANPFEEMKRVIMGQVDRRIKQASPVKLGTIDPDYTSGRPSIVFDGESVPSVKQYPYLSTYTPQAGDRVMLIRNVVVGKIV